MERSNEQLLLQLAVDLWQAQRSETERRVLQKIETVTEDVA